MQQADSRIQELYEALHDKMLRVAYRMVGSIETAEDLVQRTFLLALFHREEFERHPMPEGWLMRTLQNLALNERRQKENHPEEPLDSVLQIPADAPTDSLTDSLPRELPMQDREILIWRFEQGLDYDEIADRLGISEAGCRSRLFRAVKRCRELLKRE